MLNVIKLRFTIIFYKMILFSILNLGGEKHRSLWYCGLQKRLELSLSFNSPVPLIFTPVANLLLYEWIVSTTDRNIKGKSNILGHNTGM